MAQNQDDQGTKQEMAEGMSKAGKDQVTGGEAGRGQHGHGADPGKLTQGMSEAGKHPTAPLEDQGTAAPEDDKTAGSGGSDKITEGMSEAGKDPTDPLEDQAGGAPS